MIRTIHPSILLAAAAACASAPAAPRDVPPAPPFAAELPGAPALGGRPPLRTLLEAAAARNPRILAARSRALAEAESPRVEGALPDPMLMLGWYETSVQTRVGPQEWSLGVQQAVPWPGKLSARAGIARTVAERERVLYERTVRDVFVEVVQAAHELAYLDEAIAITARIAPLLERYVAAAAGEDPASPLNELFRAETQRAQLDNDRVLLAELREVEAERLRALLALPPGVPVGTPRVPVPPPVDAPLPELLATARAHSHELRAAGLSLEAALERLDLARAARWPDFTLGATTILTDRLDFANPPGNGDDPVILQLGVSVPLWAGKNRARIRRARAQADAAAHERSEADASLRARLARVVFRVDNSRRLVRLYEEILLPRAETAARTAEDLAASGKGTLGGSLETIAVLHGFRLAAARARADHGQAVAELEAILGRPLAPAEEAE